MTLEGENHLESVLWRDSRTGQTMENKIRHIFLMTGVNPNSSWLTGCVVFDAKGFIKIGSDLSPENLNDACWPINRHPYLLETSCLAFLQ